MFRRIVFLLALMFAGAFSALAQPVVSYILPDICAPGMNIYAEIYAPYNAHLGNNRNFGVDGFYSNNPDSDVRVECFNPADTNLITFGPIVVSWYGRLISTQVFVNPTAMPQSWDWAQGISAPFRVFANGSYSNVDTIFIVQPFTMGDIRGSGERVLGEGILGRRSKRGAMLIDYVVLANASYTVSTADRDFYKPGSQGYLPFILIAQWGVWGEGGARISVDGGLGMVQNAGPGGGGGGGRFCDRLFGSGRGEDGGAGYTGGGPGGTNDLNGGGDKRNVGRGTGSDGTSLNGMPPGYTHLYWESAGGGTGHPFGAPGEGSYTQGDESRIGGYGGGSGYKNDQAGGSGGYSTAGHGLGQTGGKSHGNLPVVPIAGGSGAASGNPQGGIVEVCAGSGGGGGGAIRICAEIIDNVALSAAGARGGEPGGGHRGGHGSGGHIAAQAKQYIQRMSLSAPGGSYGSNSGGSGRIRWDTHNFGSDVGYPSGGESVFRGPTTDTSKFAYRTHTLTGSRNDNASIKLWLKAENGPWQDVTSALNYVNPTSWEALLTLPAPDSVFYFTVLQELPNPIADTFAYTPQYIFSQAAANVLRINKKSRCVPDTLLYANVIACIDTSVSVTAWIRNKGEGVLILDFDNSTFMYGFPGFELVSPKVKTYVAPNDSVAVVIKYIYNRWPTNQIVDVLWVQHNDSSGLVSNPLEIVYIVNIDQFNFHAVKPDLKTRLDTLYLGTVCKNMATEGEFAVINNSDIKITLMDNMISSGRLSAEITGKIMLSPSGDTTTVRVWFDGSNTIGKRIYELVLKMEECPDEDYFDTVYVVVDVVESDLVLQITDPLPPNILQVRTNQRGIIKALLTNNGTAPAEIDNLEIQPNPPFRIISPILPILLNPSRTIEVEIEFAPITEGMFSGRLTAFSAELRGEELSCPDTVSVDFQAEALFSAVTLSKSTLDFGDVLWCETKLDTFFVGNSEESTTSYRIISDPVISGTGFAYYRIITKPQIPRTLQPGETAMYVVEFTPGKGSAEIINASISIKTDNSADEEITVLLTGNREKIIIEILPTNEVNFGDVLIESTWIPKIKFYNRSSKAANLKLLAIQKIAGEIETTLNFPDAEIPPKDSAFIEPKFVFKSVTLLELRLVFISDYPCPDTIVITFRANGIKGSLDYPDSIHFGNLRPCETLTRQVCLENTGSTKIAISDIRLPVGSPFSFADAITLPDTILPGENLCFDVIFDSFKLKAEKHIGNLLVTAIIDNKFQIIDIKLIGDVRTEVSVSPARLDFGRVLIGRKSEMQFSIGFTGNWELALVNLEFSSGAGAFRELPPVIDNEILHRGSRISTIEFSPTYVAIYRDTARILFYHQPLCDEPDTLFVELVGEGFDGSTLELWLPDTLVTPKLENFRLPVLAKVAESDRRIERLLLDSLEISFDRSLFYPVSIDKGEIYKNIVNDNIRTLGIKDILKSDITPNRSEILHITGYTMLGEEKECVMTIDKAIINETSDVAAVETFPGKLKIEICEEGGDRLLSLTAPKTLSANPNPAVETLEVSAFTSEAGDCSVELVNALGQKKLLKRWTNPKSNLSSERILINTNSISAGYYYLIFTTTAGALVEPVMIVK